MTCGIYCIENLKNGKKYIGQSKDIEYRYKCHVKKLNKGIHKNSHLQNSWKMYGDTVFNFLLVEECSEENLNNLEVLYITNWKTLSPNGYNLTNGGEGVSGYTHSEERKRIYPMFLLKKYSGGAAWKWC